ncbi:MAG TPA: DUF4166 domain-containing protein [Candidatus Limnocylindrales bacterium]|nr:DUF4166 domain-containing protein [Candidatus Limnocylindrales bacterium]
MPGVGKADGVESAWAFRFHLGEASVRGIGSFEVQRGPARVARLLCALMRAPVSGSAVPVRVDVLRRPDGEVWTRVIGGRTYVSRQARRSRRVQERIGPLELDFRIAVEADGLEYEQVRATFRLGRLRLPIPRGIVPTVRARVQTRGEHSFFVRVDASGPGALPLFSYYGVVEEV